MHAVPLYKKEDVPFAVKSYFKNVGIPPAFVCDHAIEQIAGSRAKKSVLVVHVITVLMNAVWSILCREI